MGQMSSTKGNALPLPLGIIKVIHVASINIRTSHHKRVLNVTLQQGTEVSDQPKKRIKLNNKLIAFGDDDLEGTSQPHDNTLVVTSRIGGFVVKRVLID